jgi:predicted P-loop ATPase
MRRAYGRNHEDIKRLAMLCGTSNDSDIISDSSNRRIVPINATDIDLETYYSIDKTDALIEAYHLYTSDGQTGFLSKEENKILQSVSLQNTSPDVHAELLTSKFHPGEPNEPECITMTASEIASIIQQKTQLKITAVGIGRVLSRLEYPFTMERQAGLSPKKVYFVRPVSL